LEVACAADEGFDDIREEQSSYGWYDENGVRQGGLMAFIRYFWDVIEPATPFVDGWPLWCLAEHLEAVSRGEIKRLLINIFPGAMKSLCTNVFFPAWEWGALARPHERYLSFSYSANLTVRDNRRLRDLVSSEKYQRLYSDHVHLRNDAVNLLLLEETGWKQASSVGGTATGARASRVLLDDPHSVAEAESDTIRSEAVRWFREAMSNRLQDMDNDAIIIICQRVHFGDVSGVIVEEELGYAHVMVPMEFDSKRQLDGDGQPVRTAINWHDPRALLPEPDGVLAWPARFSPAACEKMKKELGNYAWAGQYLQSPVPRGGGIFKRHWWRLLEPEPDGTWPKFDLVIASLDAAYTEKTTNDPSALVVLGIFHEKVEPSTRAGVVDERTGHIWHSASAALRPRVALISAQRLWKPLHGDPVERLPAETPRPGDTQNVIRQRNLRYTMRAKEQWGLVETIAHTCRRLQVSRLLIENKATGISVAQEMRRIYRDEPWTVTLLDPRGGGLGRDSSKLSRYHATVPLFANGIVFAPNRDFAEMVINEMENVPFSAHDDLADAVVQGLRWLRDNGMMSTDEEAHMNDMREIQSSARRISPIYPV
jgi:predicted phage terminase large subunit-like protein